MKEVLSKLVLETVDGLVACIKELMQYLNDIVNSIIHASLYIYNLYLTHTNFLSL